jgi:hypothetical protein
MSNHICLRNQQVTSFLLLPDLIFTVDDQIGPDFALIGDKGLRWDDTDPRKEEK